jgi:signal transduction histidine kinase
MAALDTLVARSRAAGLDVEVEETGERRALPPGVDQAAYRIVREALTNASRHGTGTARVELSYGSSALELSVTNPLRMDSGEERTGHGIVGMRERAALVDGTLEAGAEGGSFRVRATLPYREVS